MRGGPEIKRGAGWMWEGAFDFLELFGSFWGDAKKNRTFDVKLWLNFGPVFFVRSTFSVSPNQKDFNPIPISSEI